jgi:plasmid stabilization system protein ParE
VAEQWLASHGDAPSAFDAELAEALIALRTHPLLGRLGDRKNTRLIALRRTGYVVLYRIYPRLREVRVHNIIHGALYASRARERQYQAMTWGWSPGSSQLSVPW